MSTAALPLPSTAAHGVLSLLDEDDAELKSFALRKLDAIVDESWAEMAGKASDIEELAEDAAFADRTLAARVASKIFYHLEAYPEALRLALQSEDLFDIAEGSEYTEKMIGQCIDEYTEARHKHARDPSAPAPDARMEEVVMRMFERCFDSESWGEAIGMAIETRRLDMLEAAVDRAGHGTAVARGMLSDAFSVATRFVTTREYRMAVFKVLRAMHMKQSPMDYVSLMRVLEALRDAETTARILVDLLRGDGGGAASAASSSSSSSAPTGRTFAGADHDAEANQLMALQLAFDMAETDNQRFLADVAKALPGAEAAAADAGADAQRQAAVAAAAAASAAIASGSSAAAPAPAAPSGPLPDAEDPFWARLRQVRLVLRREPTLRLHIHFLFRACSADRGILKRLKLAQVKARFNPVAHHALIVAAALMHAGTTLDFFYRDNIEWIRRATNWARFSAIASVGVYHKGNVENAMRVLRPLLPGGGGGGQSPSVEGGALFALGLIQANRGAIEGDDALPTLLQHASSHDQVIQHGACLGLGLAGMGSCNDLVFERLQAVLSQKTAVAPEAAGLGTGLLLAGHGASYAPLGGRGEPAVLSLLRIASESEHEKTARGASMGVALSCLGLEEAADTVIEQMVIDKDPIVRYGAQFARAMAYTGSAERHVIRDLLHTAVSDVSDDVRRAAVMALGFVLHRKPRDVPKLVGLLAESFNPHVRYGAAMALGIAAAATGLPSAIHILKPLLEDPVDFVRQGAFMATAMVLQQESEARTPFVKDFRERIMAEATSQRKPAMSRMGAILAAGIIDAGGRNCVVSLASPSGLTKPTAVLGMALFTQYWYWFPLLHCLSLATAPTALVAVVPVKGAAPDEFRLPSSFALDCRCRPALFAYPDALSDKEDDKAKKVTKVELSTASRTKARSRQRQLMRLRSQRSDGSRLGRSASQALAGSSSSATAGGEAAGSPKGGAADDASRAGSAASASSSAAPESPSKAAKDAAPAKEATRFPVPNASRVALPQRKFLATLPGQRWAPVRGDVTSHVGVLVVRDTTRASGSGLADSTDGDLDEIKRPRIGEDAAEPAPPAAFTFNAPDDEWDAAALADTADDERATE